MVQGSPNVSDSSESRVRNARQLGAGHRAKSSSSPLAGRVTETAADKATAAFIRRILCAHHIQPTGDKTAGNTKSIDELLPPLTSSNEIDLELYAFIAIIVKDFVYSWYAKITPDHVFTDEIIRIIAHCCRALEERARHLDLEALLMDEVPKLLDNHIAGYRTATQASQPYGATTTDIRKVYHALQPHPALSPVPDGTETSEEEEQDNEAAWRQLLVRGALAILLPTEDLENPCLHALVVEICSELILGNAVCGRACENWMLWELVVRTVEILRPREDTEAGVSDGGAGSGRGRLAQFGLLSTQEELLKPVKSGRDAGGSTPSLSGALWRLVQYAFLAVTATRAIIVLLLSASSLPSRAPPSILPASSSTDGRGTPPVQEAAAALGPQRLAPRPLVSMHVWSWLCRLVELEQRMPWLAGLLSLLRWGSLNGVGKVGDTDGALDRILSAQVRTHLLSPARLPSALRAARAALFPNNALAPPRAAIPTPDESLRLRRRAAQAVLSTLPPGLCALYFADAEEEAWTAAVEGWLDALADPYLNRHLVVALVELLAVRLMPELARSGPETLLDERLGGGKGEGGVSVGVVS